MTYSFKNSLNKISAANQFENSKTFGQNIHKKLKRDAPAVIIKYRSSQDSEIISDPQLASVAN